MVRLELRISSGAFEKNEMKPRQRNMILEKTLKSETHDTDPLKWSNPSLVTITLPYESFDETL